MIDGLPLVDLGQGALLAIVVLLILTGRLVPRRTVDLMHEAIKKREDQLDRLIVGIETSNRFIEAVVNTATERTEGGEEP